MRAVAKGGTLMKRCILVVGEGLMAEGASQQLSAEYNVIRRSDFENRIPAETSFVCVGPRLAAFVISRGRKSAKGGRDSLASRVCIFWGRGNRAARLSVRVRMFKMRRYEVVCLRPRQHGDA